MIILLKIVLRWWGQVISTKYLWFKAYIILLCICNVDYEDDDGGLYFTPEIDASGSEYDNFTIDSGNSETMGLGNKYMQRIKNYT